MEKTSEQGPKGICRPSGGSGGGHFLYADCIRICASLAVVALHVSAVTVVEYGRINYWDWFAGNMVDSASRWAVPLFVMLSGALLLDPGKTESPGVFYVKRSRRILIPMVFWPLFCYVWYGAWSGVALRFGDAVRMIAFGSHLYYLIIIAFIYAITPWLRLWVRGAPAKSAYFVLFFLIVGFLDALSYYSAGRAEDPLTVRMPLNFLFFTVGFTGYFVGGHYLMSREISTGWMHRLSPAAVLVSFLVIVAGTSSLVMLYGPGRAGLCLYDYFSPPVIVMSFALFIYFKGAAGSRMTEEVGAPASVVRTLSDASFGVYLIHPFIEDIARRGMDKLWVGDSALSFSPRLGIPVLAAAVFCVSAAVTVFIRRVAYLRAIVGG